MQANGEASVFGHIQMICHYHTNKRSPSVLVLEKKLKSGVRVSKQVSEKSWKSQSWQKCFSKKLVELELTFLISSRVCRVRVSYFFNAKVAKARVGISDFDKSY